MTLLLITFKRLESVALDVSERLITIVLLKLLVPLLETDQNSPFPMFFVTSLGFVKLGEG